MLPLVVHQLRRLLERALAQREGARRKGDAGQLSARRERVELRERLGALTAARVSKVEHERPARAELGERARLSRLERAAEGTADTVFCAGKSLFFARGNGNQRTVSMKRDKKCEKMVKGCGP